MFQADGDGNDDPSSAGTADLACQRVRAYFASQREQLKEHKEQLKEVAALTVVERHIRERLERFGEEVSPALYRLRHTNGQVGKCPRWLLHQHQSHARPGVESRGVGNKATIAEGLVGDVTTGRLSDDHHVALVAASVLML